MRLTLRTLIAWLDDTLPPAEVRQIGQQVAESPFAQELVERIHRVSRQRRLTVPNATGSDATDPALVASYLDNELSPEQVAEFEKRCLTSDVHLAEVASVHQILSLIGQKAKVPPEARQRMYRLVRGREAVRPEPARVAATMPAEPAAAPIAPWTPPEPVRRSPWERFGPLAIVAGLLVALIWSAWQMAPRSNPANDSAALIIAQENRTKSEPAPQPKPAGEPAATKPAESPKTPEAAAATPSATPSNTAETTAPADQPAPEKVAATDEATPKTATPAGVGSVPEFDGILMRPNANGTGWERLQSGTALKSDDRLVGLPPFRNAVQLGTARLEIIGDGEIRVRPVGAGETCRFDLVHGHVVVQTPTPQATIGVGFGGKYVSLKFAPDVPVGLERVNHRGPGDTEPAPASLKVYISKGEAKVAAGRSVEVLTGPASIEFRPPDRLFGKDEGISPAWVTDTKLSPIDEQTGKELAKYFTTDQSPVSSIMQAIENEQDRVRQLAVFALGAIGGTEEVTAALSNPDAAVRRAAIIVLRNFQARSPEAAKDLRAILQNYEQSQAWAALVEKLLMGYSAREAKMESTYTQLVGLLKHKDVAVRELALNNLLFLTGRDTLEYDPDKPEGPGLKAWQELLKSGELTPPAADRAR
jgi:hypothetical protein